MIQFNLLPDIKVKYLKSRRQKHLVVVTATIATIASLALFLLLISYVQVVQKKSISDLNRDIQSSGNELQNTPDLTKVLTVQNQLKSLPSLHDKKPVASRLFTYISQVTPTQASVGKLRIDFEKHTISISGVADSLNTVNTFADTLKFTTYTTDQNSKSKSAFSNVVLAAFGRDNKGANFTLTLGYDQTIFNETANPTLTVPQITTTRSSVEQPTALFQGSNQ